MSTTPTGQVDERFSDSSAQPPEWPEVEAALAAAELYWFTTVRRDGRPHVTPLVGVWSDHAFSMCTGVGEQKHRNLSFSSHVAVTTGCNDWARGTDLVVEGTAERVTGREALAPLAAAWRDKYGDTWAWDVDDEGFVGTVGEHPARPRVYTVRPSKVLVFGKDPHAQFRYTFS